RQYPEHEERDQRRNERDAKRTKPDRNADRRRHPNAGRCRESADVAFFCKFKNAARADETYTRDYTLNDPGKPVRRHTVKRSGNDERCRTERHQNVCADARGFSGVFAFITDQCTENDRRDHSDADAERTRVIDAARYVLPYEFHNEPLSGNRNKLSQSGHIRYLYVLSAAAYQALGLKPEQRTGYDLANCADTRRQLVMRHRKLEFRRTRFARTGGGSFGQKQQSKPLDNFVKRERFDKFRTFPQPLRQQPGRRERDLRKP